MNPKKAKELLPNVSQETGLDIQLLKDLTDFYWDSIHKELVSLEHNHVMIQHLGTFHIRNEEILNKTISKYERMVYKARKDPPKTMVRFAIYKNNERRIEKLQKLLENHLSEKIKKKEIKKIRKDVREHKESMGSQIPNPGGTQELNLSGQED
jgi:exonuclease VII large subunit